MKKTDESGVVTLSVSSLDENTELRPCNTPAAAVGTLFKQLSSLLADKTILPEQDILFDSVSEGCTQLAVRAASGRHDALAAKIQSLTDGQLMPIRETLGKYNCYADLAAESSGFSKRLLPKTVPETYEVFQEETFRGRLINIGGKDETVPVKLLTMQGDTLSLTADTGLARRMAAHLFDFIECTGRGLLEMGAGFSWKPVNKKFKIHDFEVLPAADYDAFLENFRAIESDWRHDENPLEKAAAIRRGDL